MDAASPQFSIAKFLKNITLKKHFNNLNSLRPKSHWQ